MPKAYVHVASCAARIVEASSEIQLLPAGPFRGVDGRPENAPHWLLDPERAKGWLAVLRQRKTPLVIDYEHQSLQAATSGNAAPAAARFNGAGLEIRAGALWATDVRWTARARQMIEDEEYGYLSPVFAYQADGLIVGLYNAALTNTPAIDGMEPVFRAVASQFPQGDSDVKKEIREALGLPEDASDEAVVAACKQVVADRDAAQADKVAAEQKLAAASQNPGGNPDPAKYVSVEAFNDLRNKFAALGQEVSADKVGALVTAALEDGRLLPAQKEWAQQLGSKDLAALTQYLDSATPLPGLRAGQTSGAPSLKGADGMTPEDIAVCQQMQIDPADFRQANGMEVQDAGH